MSRVTIEGIQEAQMANLRAIEAMEPNGAFGKAIKDITMSAHAYAVKITHVDSGALKASHRMKIEQQGYRGVISLDGRASGPNGNPAEYGPYEHGRGGSHAFYERTVREAGRGITDKAVQRIVRAGVYGR